MFAEMHFFTHRSILQINFLFDYFRYVAVRNPIDYNQAMNDAAAIRLRLLKFLLPVIIFSVLFNFPKFFESTYVTVTRNVSWNELEDLDDRHRCV